MMSEADQTAAAPTGEPISRLGRNVAWSVALIAALLSIAVGVVLVFTYASGETITEEQLGSLRAVLAEQPDNEAVKQQFRELDAKVRQQYHARIDRYETGAFWLVIGIGVMLLSGAIGAELGRELPAPEQAPEPEPLVQRISRASVAFGVGLLCVVGVYLAYQGRTAIDEEQFASAIHEIEQKEPADKSQSLASKTGNTEKTPDNVKPTQPDTGDDDTSQPDANETPQPKDPAEAKYASYEEYAKQWATFRGFEGRAVCNFKDIPQEWNEETGKNIAWKSPIPMKGLSSPIVWGDKVFVTGASREKREVYCFDAKTGQKLWTGQYKSNPDAPSDYDVYDSVSELMHAAPTPVADGTHVYAMFGNGEVVCFDFNGKLVWSRYVASPMDNMYGNSGSLLKYKNTLIVLIDGEELGLYGLNGLTGKQIWSGERYGNTWASPILIKTPKGKVQVVVSSNPTVEGFDPNDGKNLWRSENILGGDVAPTPTFDGQRVYAAMNGYSLVALDPDREGKMLWEVWELEYASLPDATSPVSDGKHVWFYHAADLVCINDKGETIYEQEMDGYTSYASPTIVNGKLWTFSDNKTIVGTTGAEWKQTRVNELAKNARLDASPAFAPGRVFLRAGGHLYCIAKTEK
ncbi:MAG: PQQ-binding-like beta-propeller repeat protein [Phycisphaerae bacterium]